MLLLLRTSSSNVREAPSGVLGAGKRQQRHRELFLLISGCRCLPAKPWPPSGCVLSAQRVLGLAALCREWVRCAQTLTVEGREGREAVREGRQTYTAPAPHALLVVSQLTLAQQVAPCKMLTTCRPETRVWTQGLCRFMRVGLRPGCCEAAMV